MQLYKCMKIGQILKQLWLANACLLSPPKAAQAIAILSFKADDVFVFGPETRGLPEEIRNEFTPEFRLRLPMLPESRSLNLSNSAAVLLYEAWRQIGFEGGFKSSSAFLFAPKQIHHRFSRRFYHVSKRLIHFVSNRHINAHSIGAAHHFARGIHTFCHVA